MCTGTRVAGHVEWPLALYYLNENLNTLTVLHEILQYGVHEVGLKLLHVYRQTEIFLIGILEGYMCVYSATLDSWASYVCCHCSVIQCQWR